MASIPLPTLDGDTDQILLIDDRFQDLVEWLEDFVIRDDSGLAVIADKLRLGSHAGLMGALLTVVATTNGIEWGHHETGGYRCSLGAESGTGKPFIGFNCEHGTNTNTYRTRGLPGVVIRSELDGTLTVGQVALPNANNQALTNTFKLYAPPTWTNLGTGINTGAGWSTSVAVPQYRKVGDEVQLRGRITSPGAGGSSQPATLPVNFRPAVDYEGYGRIGSGGTYGTILIATTGVITIGGTPSTGGVVLDGIRFSTTA